MKASRSFPPVLFGISVLIFSAVATAKTPAEKQNPLTEFQMSYPGTSILLHKNTGTPAIIANIDSQPQVGSTLEIAHAFLLETGNLLMPGGSPSELQTIQVQRSRNAEHLHFQQVYSGIPIYRGIVSLHIQDGRIVMYTGHYHPPAAFSNLALQPSLSESQAEGIALQRLGGTSFVSLRGDIQIARYIYPSATGQYHLAYQVKLPAAVPLGDWELIIDAHTGQVLGQHNRLMHAEPIEGGVDGTASIYEENPLTTRVPVDAILPYLDESGFLRGDFIDVLTYDGTTGVRVDSRQFDSFLKHNAFSPDYDFHYEPDDPRFDEANVYFHINRIHDYFKEAFDFTERDSPLTVIVGYPGFNEQNRRVLDGPMDNAFFSPFKQRLAIGSGTGRANGGLNNLARDADVLYHEYTHAVIDRITLLGQVPDDFGDAMNEGYADYFASSFFNDPDMGEWSVNRQSGMRNLNHSNRFPDNIYQPGTGAIEAHYTGLIWGGACWELRETIGQQVADQIVFNSLYFLPKDGSANFQIGLTALLQADESVFDSTHQEVIHQVFHDRGICESTGCPLVLGEKTRGSISGVELLGLSQYRIEVPNTQGTLQLDLRSLANGVDLDLYVRFDKPVAVVQRRGAAPQVTATHRSEGERGIESITITPESNPALQPGTYYVAIVNWDNAPGLTDYDLTATIVGPALSVEPLNPPPIARLMLTPTMITLEAGKQQKFSTTVEGAEDLALVWQVNGVPGGNESVGTIKSDGVYTAPATVADLLPISIVVISEGDASIRAEVLIMVVPRPRPIESADIPDRSALLPNYPNPFNPETWLPYELAEPAHVTISIYDGKGRLTRQLDVGPKAAGSYLARESAAYWDGRDNFGEVVANGIYFYHIQAGEFRATRRMVVVK